MDPLIVTAAEYARLRKRSPAWVSGRIKDGLPVVEQGKSGREYQINVADAFEWELQQEAASEESDRSRLNRAQAERVEFENEVRKGDFIPVAVHADLLVGVAGEIARQMAGLPGRIAGELAGMNDAALVRARLIDECNDVRNAVAKHLDGIAESAEPALPVSGADHGGAETDDAGSVGGREPHPAAGDRGAGEVAVQ